MMQSMTGYGKTICDINNKSITIEIKSLNSKQLDLYTRIPGFYKEKEIAIRNIISQELKRGKIELCITYEDNGNETSAKINVPLVKAYFYELENLRKEINYNIEEPLLQTILRFPDTLKTEKEELDEKEWQAVENKIREAIDAAAKFRTQEGKALQKDISERVSNILSLLESIAPHESERIKLIRERLYINLKESVDIDKIDENRFEQELIYYLEKIDITEEKVRLKNHCDFFNEVMDMNKPVGKKLGFISQEMGREINTIGSKANHSEIQRIVVQMKDELEKIKEQLMNVL
ncbi:MAG: YicC family protein [Bacteroidales bacterium]|nr:YicC family protein [Bacteroidales bacterium]